jgi:hypothetical protein
VRVVDCVAGKLRARGVTVTTFEDKTSTSQSQNLNTIVAFHNGQPKHDYDVSIHFNAYTSTPKPMGTECLWKTQEALANTIADAVAAVGYVNRHGKYRDDLAFLNNTREKSVLIETCFVDSQADVALYQSTFDETCEAIATALSGQAAAGVTPPVETEREEVEQGEYLFSTQGKCSYFGGPHDTGVSASEGLAFHSKITKANEHLFLPLVPSGTTGLARRLNAQGVHYIACRWDYAVTPKTMLAGPLMALVTNVKTGIAQTAFPADWGPAGPESDHDTGRVADLSPALMRDLAPLETDDEVRVVYPYYPES